MKLIDPATGQAVWDSNDPYAGPVPPAPEGRQWVRVDEPGDTNAPRRTAPGILDIGSGVQERLGFLNQTFNPVEGIGGAMRAGSRMMAPDQSYWDRIASLGEMASGVAGIAAPIAAARAIGVPAASAMMEGLLGGSPTGQAAGDMARRFATDESGALPGAGRGQGLPTPRNEAEAMARDILQLRAEGRADEVTEPMMLAADPQYMYMNTPLPMDYASRMARAEARGFAPTLHGTGSDISAVDEKFFGSGRDALGSGFYTTTNATRANIYAPKVKGPSIEASKEFADGANVMPLAVRMDRPFDLSEVTGRAADEIGSAAGQDPYFTYRSGESGAYIQGDEGQSAFLDPYHLRYQTLSRLREGFGPQLTSSLLSDAGYSGVVGPEASGNLVRVSFNPQDIRSRFARFDPAFANLRNLSAGVGGAAVLTALGDDAEAGTPETQIIGLVNQAGIAGAAEALGVSRRDIEEAMSIVLPPSQWDQLVVGPQ
jgi:hypothetical protein